MCDGQRVKGLKEDTGRHRAGAVLSGHLLAFCQDPWGWAVVTG